MNFSLFFPAKPKHESNIIKDILRFVRDTLAIINDLFSLKILSTVVDYLNHLVGDTQSNDMALHP